MHWEPSEELLRSTAKFMMCFFDDELRSDRLLCHGAVTPDCYACLSCECHFQTHVCFWHTAFLSQYFDRLNAHRFNQLCASRRALEPLAANEWLAAWISTALGT